MIWVDQRWFQPEPNSSKHRPGSVRALKDHLQRLFTCILVLSRDSLFSRAADMYRIVCVVWDSSISLVTSLARTGCHGRAGPSAIPDWVPPSGTPSTEAIPNRLLHPHCGSS